MVGDPPQLRVYHHVGGLRAGVDEETFPVSQDRKGIPRNQTRSLLLFLSAHEFVSEQ